MKNIINKSIAVAISLFFLGGCGKQLTDLNINPNGVDPSNANVNTLLPGILSKISGYYSELDNSVTSGVVQHMQEDGWYTSYNNYVWTNRDWGSWYTTLIDNELMLTAAQSSNYPMHEGIAYVIKAFSFGNVTDLWGDAPYTEALMATKDLIKPKYDSQEVIYKGILEDLKKASNIFKSNSNTGIVAANDLIYQGNISKWHRLANSLILRYAMRLSEKLPDVAKSYIQYVYSEGIYIDVNSNEAFVKYLGNTSADSWYMAAQFDSDGSGFRRRKIGKTLMDKLITTKDPRLTVWIAPVNCQWVQDLTLTVGAENFIRKDGVAQSYVSLTEAQYIPLIAAGSKFTRRYNPNLYGSKLDTSRYVGIPAGAKAPDSYNNNPTPGQTVQNQHVSQLTAMYKANTGEYLKRRIATAPETLFILAEAAQRGWITASAETFYNNAINQSLQAWGKGSAYTTFIADANVKYNNTLQRIIEQKWIASWNCSVEAWMDFRRTGYPALAAGPDSAEPVVPVRFIYGNNELLTNADNVNEAIAKIQETPYSNAKGKNSQWAKPWLLQGTSKPW